MNTAEANRAWVRDLLWRKDRQFAEMLDHMLRAEVIALCAQSARELTLSRSAIAGRNHVRPPDQPQARGQRRRR
jgi:hypothetical protein